MSQLLAALEYSLDHTWEETVEHLGGHCPSVLLEAVFRVSLEDRHNLLGVAMIEDSATHQRPVVRMPLEDTGPWQDNAIRQMEEE